MLVTNARRKNEKEWEFDLQITTDEVSYFVNTGIGLLLVQGEIALQEQDEEQVVQLPEQTHPAPRTAQ